MLDLTAFETRDAAMHAAADAIAESLENGLKTRGSACAALSGGSTPAPAYRALATYDLDWSKITFALVDERFVPVTHQASNEGLIVDTLTLCFERGARFRPMSFPASTVTESAQLASELYAPLQIDVALMGMGEDGHTASWFPGARGLSEALDLTTKDPVVAVHAPHATGSADRLTLTRRSIAGAGRVLLLITGAEKRAVLEAALAGPVHAKPVAALFSAPVPTPQVFWAP